VEIYPRPENFHGEIRKKRNLLMNIRLTLARVYVPFWIQKKKLKELFALTAQAFQSEEPALEGLSQKEVLEKYAIFTKENTEKLLVSDEKTKIAKDQLYKKAFQMGSNLREELRISSPKEFMASARLLYHLIGIDFRGEKTGRITIRKCYFKRFYSEDICKIISSLDKGILAGLSGGTGKLEFLDRLTSGADCCRAVFHFGDRTG